MKSVPAGLRRQVVFRANDRCEYCGLAQEGQEATFHIDHIVPKAAGGPAAADNLALVCVRSIPVSWCGAELCSTRVTVSPSNLRSTQIRPG